ncbi:MAG TPA: hypothetical protein VNL74_01040 [Methylococcus sp.]|nr:hypothetical protein [Methylococcus sp.]
MALLKRSQIDRPVRKREAMDCPELCGEVVVQALLLRDKIEFLQEGSGAGHVSRLLAATVVDADGEPLFTADEWEVFGADHIEAVNRLFEVAARLSGLSLEHAEKKSEGPSAGSSTG